MEKDIFEIDNRMIENIHDFLFNNDKLQELSVSEAMLGAAFIMEFAKRRIQEVDLISSIDFEKLMNSYRQMAKIVMDSNLD